MLSALFLGGLVGALLPNFAGYLEIFSVIFVKLLKMIAIPLLFFMVVSSTAGHESMRKVVR